MTLRIVRLGSPRAKGEGIRIGTVRRPPRGVPRAEFATQDWYDTWFPTLAPESATLSHQADFSVGCYCADEAQCHRSILRELLSERGARIA